MREVTTKKIITETTVQTIELKDFTVTLSISDAKKYLRVTDKFNDPDGVQQWCPYIVTPEELAMLKKLSFMRMETPRYYPQEIRKQFQDWRSKSVEGRDLKEIFQAIVEEKATILFCSGYDSTFVVDGKRYKTHVFDDIGGGLVNDIYNLKGAFGHLRELEKTNPNIFVPSAEMQSIPSYNREHNHTHYIEFSYCEELKEYRKFSWDEKYKILSQLGFDAFKIKKDE